MGKIKQGILGGFSGKVAGVVGTSWKGIAVIKSLPLSVANPKTPGQVAQRGAFSNTVAAARSLLAFLITTYWNPFAQRMSGYNRFVQENIATFTAAGFTSPENFYASRGSLTGVVVSGTDGAAGTDELTVEWSDNSGTGDALATDNIILVAYNETLGTWIYSDGTATRDDGSITIPTGVLGAGDLIHSYLFSARPNLSKASDSVYSEVTAS